MNITPKEKAVELVDKHRTIIRKADLYGHLPSEDEILLAKESALINVSEIIKAASFFEYPYWKRVKQEIEELKSFTEKFNYNDEHIVDTHVDEVIRIHAIFFDISPAKQRKTLRILLFWAIKHYLKILFK